MRLASLLGLPYTIVYQYKQPNGYNELRLDEYGGYHDTKPARREFCRAKKHHAHNVRLWLVTKEEAFQAARCFTNHETAEAMDWIYSMRATWDKPAPLEIHGEVVEATATTDPYWYEEDDVAF